MATYLDEEGQPQWYPATIVEFRPHATKYFYVAHFDADGVDFKFGFPEDGVRMLPESVTHCMCPRCTLLDHAGRDLSQPL